MLLGEVSDFYCMIWFLRDPYKKIKIISDRIFFYCLLCRHKESWIAICGIWHINKNSEYLYYLITLWVPLVFYTPKLAIYISK